MAGAGRRQGALREAAEGVRRCGRAGDRGRFDGDTFRAVYTVRFAMAVYVLNAFQKKSKHGIGTPKTELDLIDQRLKRAREDYEQWSKSEKPKFR
jgi:phage-related protein